ncbi:MAG: hypothetical protein EBE86_029970 [Hormoscilla sp. GUM202]|nr:hypothetical protein [Hormoscilla sp. GUM202]MBO1351324.1 hypothetical protein [Hormoscilla sp. GUM202]
MTAFMNPEEKKQLISSLVERLQEHPHLLMRFSSVLDIVENIDDTCETASCTESKLIVEFQKMGKEALEDWGKTQEKKKAKACEQSQP